MGIKGAVRGGVAVAALALVVMPSAALADDGSCEIPAPLGCVVQKVTRTTGGAVAPIADEVDDAVGTDVLGPVVKKLTGSSGPPPSGRRAAGDPDKPRSSGTARHRDRASERERGDGPRQARNSPAATLRAPSGVAAGAPSSETRQAPPPPKGRFGAAAVETARTLAFPLALMVVVMAFVAAQSRLDHSDPKLAAAPVDGDLVTFR